MFRLVALTTLLACAFGAAIPDGVVPLWEARIIGGKDTTIESYPYTVSMKSSGSHRCGGSIINNDVVISAAQCVKGVSASSLTIAAGTSYRTTGGVSIKVSRIVMHEKYDSWDDNNDVAILFLTSGFKFGRSIQPIALASSTKTAQPGEQATCTGWGISKGDGSLPNILQTVDVTVVSNADCAKAYLSIWRSITSTMMCAGETAGGKDACNGDSGGPLAIGNTLVGIVSWGQGCAQKGYPGVYASVSALRSWIDSKL